MKFDCIRVYKWDDVDGIEFVVKPVGRIIEKLIHILNKDCDYSKLNDGRLVVRPQDYKQFMDCLKNIQLNNDDIITINTFIKGDEVYTDIDLGFDFDQLIKFAKEYLQDPNWERLQREYLTRSFTAECNIIFNNKVVNKVINNSL